jgi:ABC-type molybdate transport system permease subunit
VTDLLAPAEWGALRISLIVALYSVVFSLPLAIAVAWLLARGRFWGRVHSMRWFTFRSCCRRSSSAMCC